MTRTAERRALLGTLLALSLSAACSRQIGDSCQTAADCDPNGGRICDLSEPGGYCTILGCNETTCPSEAACIQNFPAQYLTKPCNPKCEDLVCVPDGGVGAGTDGGPVACPASCPNGPTNDCTTDEVCLDEGLCAPRAIEVRACEKVCSSNDDCRGGYVCRQTGTQGSMLVSTTPDEQTSVCSPNTE